MKIVLGIVLLFMFTACSSEHSIEGKWRLTEIDFTAHLATLDAENRKSFEAIIEKQSVMLDLTYFNFLEDSVLQVITPQKDGTGQIMQIEKWGISKNHDSLYLINPETELFHVNHKVPNKLVLTSDAAPKRKLVLVKDE